MNKTIITVIIVGIAIACNLLAWRIANYDSLDDYSSLLQTAEMSGKKLPPTWTMNLFTAIIHGIDSLRDYLIPEELRSIELITAFTKTKTLGAAIELGIANIIPLTKEKDKQGNLRWPTAAEIAQNLGIEDNEGEDRVYRLLRLLATFGVFKHHAPRSFSHSRLSVLLREDHPAHSSGMLRSWFDQSQGWNALAHQIKTGDLSFKTVTGQEMWSWLNMPDNARALQDFQQLFDAMSEIMTPPLVWDFDWRAVAAGMSSHALHVNKSDAEQGQDLVIADIGGGMGSVLEAILGVLPKANGILFDQPEVIAYAQKHPRWDSKSELGKRSTLIGGSFLQKVPEADIYILRMIIHDWNDKEAIKILENIKKAILERKKHKNLDNTKCRVFLVEQVLPQDGQHSHQLPLSVEQGDIHMMTMLNGKERTEQQFEQLFHTVGFHLDSISYTRGVFHIIQAYL